MPEAQPRAFRPRKIRLQLTLAITAVVALVVALTGVFLVLRADRNDRAVIDRALTTRAAQVRAAAVKTGTLPTDGSYAVRLLDGTDIRAERGTTTKFSIPVKNGYSTVTAADGSHWRSWAETAKTGAQLQILINLASAEERHAGNVRMIDLAVVLAALIAGLGTWLVAGLVLRPLNRLAAARADPAGSDPASSDSAGSDHAGSDHAGSDHAGSDHAGSDHAGSDSAGSGLAGPGPAGSDPAKQGAPPDISDLRPGNPSAAAGERESGLEALGLGGVKPSAGTQPSAGSTSVLPAALPDISDSSGAELEQMTARASQLTEWAGQAKERADQADERAAQAIEQARQASEQARRESERAEQESERAQQESERARQESERADQMAARADEMAQRADQMAARAEELQAELDRLRQAEVGTAAAEQLAGVVGEQLREPLVALGDELDQILDSPDMSAMQRHLLLAAIQNEHRRMVEMVGELEARSRGEANR